MRNIFLTLFFSLSSAFAANFDFSGTVQISGCSGFFVTFNGSKPGDQAVVMTAGHCAHLGRRMYPGEVISGRSVHIPVRFLNADASVHSHTVTTDQLLYATVTGTDLAVYTLQASYQNIMDTYQVLPLLLGDQAPKAGVQIQVLASALQTGYACAIDGFVHELREEEYVWKNSLRYTRRGCNTVGGSSGAPVIDGRRVVVGINNTGNLDGEACTGNNACEVSATGEMTFRKGSSYGQQTYQIYSCLTKKRKFDLTMKGCRLQH